MVLSHRCGASSFPRSKRPRSVDPVTGSWLEGEEALRAAWADAGRPDGYESAEDQEQRNLADPRNYRRGACTRRNRLERGWIAYEREIERERAVAEQQNQHQAEQGVTDQPQLPHAAPLIPAAPLDQALPAPSPPLAELSAPLSAAAQQPITPPPPLSDAPLPFSSLPPAAPLPSHLDRLDEYGEPEPSETEPGPSEWTEQGAMAQQDDDLTLANGTGRSGSECLTGQLESPRALGSSFQYSISAGAGGYKCSCRSAWSRRGQPGKCLSQKCIDRARGIEYR